MKSIARKDVFLDFLSPDNNGLYGTYANYKSNRQRHVALLEEGLNVAVLLCGERCLLPPFFPLQCAIARSALHNKGDYIAEGIIAFPLRETSLGDFFEKKAAEYFKVQTDYRELYDQSGRHFVESHSDAVMKRAARVGSTIASRWESGPDDSSLWEPVLQQLSHPIIEDIRQIPKRLKKNGESVTWAAMRMHLPDEAYRVAFELNQALQHEYTQIYLDEYGATIISRLPPKTTDLLLTSEDLSYDYVCLRDVLRIIHLWPALARMSAGDIIKLRHRYGYLEFMAVFHEVCRTCVTTTDVMRVFAGSTFSRVKSLRPFRTLLVGIDRAVARNLELTDNQMDLLDWYLCVITEALHCVDFRDNAPSQTRMLIDIEKEDMNTMPTIFLVHGHDHAVRDRIHLFLKEKGLEVVVLEDKAWGGKTLPEKFETFAEKSDYVIVLATADDDLTDNKTGKQLKRIRQNVVLEVGYFWGSFGRKGRFSLLLEQSSALELPSDLSGLGYIEITDDLGVTKLRLEKELVDSGLLPDLGAQT